MIQWRKSSHSGGSSGELDCVEVARLSEGVGLRDSKNPGAGHLAISPDGFATLVRRIKNV